MIEKRISDVLDARAVGGTPSARLLALIDYLESTGCESIYHRFGYQYIRENIVPTLSNSCVDMDSVVIENSGSDVQKDVPHKGFGRKK